MDHIGALKFTNVHSVKIQEMELLDINLTKESSLFLYAIHSPFYWRILKKIILYYGCTF
jgi:hypothetical protein